MGSVGGRIRQTRPFGRAWTALLHMTFLGSTGVLNARSWAQAECAVTGATPLRIKNETAVDMLRAAAGCPGGGLLAADWAGAITLDTPIWIASGVFLSITGEDTLAEVRGGWQTRMFEVSPGGELTLTHLKLSGGTETSGGAICSNASALILDSCVFHGNVATDGDGGAVWAYGGNVTILGGEFLGNNATGNGGAVAATGARLVVKEESMFEGNNALVGGALYCSGVAGSGLARSSTSCSLNDAEFTSNTATRKKPRGPRIYDFSRGVFGGGAVAFEFASASITGSVFGDNSAQHSGGALLGGNSTDITVNGCKFENNTAKEFGGAIAAASMTLGGDTQLTNNTATASGGAVLGWDPSGTIIFNDVFCTQNSAIDGGCFFATGSGVANNKTVMHNNEAQDGGCIYAYDGSDINIFGGNFMCRATSKGGFLHAEDRSSVSITGGVVEDNVAERRAGAVKYVDNLQTVVAFHCLISLLRVWCNLFCLVVCKPQKLCISRMRNQHGHLMCWISMDRHTGLM